MVARYRTLLILLLTLLITAFAALPASALTSVSQLGYHPEAVKTVTVYTGAASGTYNVVSAGGTTVKSGTLSKPRNARNEIVACQGNNACLVGDFSDLKTPGTYRITTSTGEQSAPFTINSNIYRNSAPQFNEFFDALRQQGSSYHGDLNGFLDPHFNSMADGSYLHTSDQAAATLIRLASAYRRNPQFLQSDTKTYVKAGTPDIVEHMIAYTDYLADLQDAKIQERSDGVGFRIKNGMRIDYAFVPGPTGRTSIDVYSSGNTYMQSVQVRSLCGNLTGSAYAACMDRAANVYKCQADEPCLQLTFSDTTATRVAGTDGMGVDKGWYYEFACYFDVDLVSGNYNSRVNPCMYYNATETRASTSEALLAYAEAIPPIYQYDPQRASALLDRAVATRAYIKANYPAFAANDNDAGFYGAANFILYDITGDATYLQEAYGLRSIVAKQLISDSTRGNEFYWQEYIRHKAAIEARGWAYPVPGFDNSDPGEAFRGKLFFDYKDRGFTSISNNGERVYQFDPNVQFQNSRYILTEGVIASKALELSIPDQFMKEIADAQLSWITGNNGVDIDPSFTTDLRSLSFIFGIGTNPQRFHSRLLMDSHYSSMTGGAVKGMRSIDFKFNNGTGYTNFDGRTYLLGEEFGSNGNAWRNEPATPIFDTGKAFKNGRTTIPGWINGAYDTPYDQDIIYDYSDSTSAWEYTESTNEIVATAVELFAYRDAQYNTVAWLPTPRINGTPPVCTPSNGGVEICDGVDNDCDGQIDEGNVCGGSPPPNSTCHNSVQSIPATCTGASITQDSWDGGRHITCGGTTVAAWDKTGYFEMYKQAGGSAIKICIGDTCIKEGGYAKSANFPICIGNSTPPPSCTPTNGGVEICDGVDNDCDGQVDEGNVCAPPPPSNQTCYNSVQSIPANCTGGTISADTWDGGRHITCGSTTVAAWDKSGFFEMYRQAGSGGQKICIGSTCIQHEGYAKSSNFPICIGNSTPPPPSCTPTTEVCDGRDNDCDGLIDENNVCAPPGTSASVSIAPWYPKGRDYVFICNANGFTPTSYDWNFGDGNKAFGRTVNDVYYRYSAAGNYNVACTAKNGGTSATGTLAIAVV